MCQWKDTQRLVLQSFLAERGTDYRKFCSLNICTSANSVYLKLRVSCRVESKRFVEVAVEIRSRIAFPRHHQTQKHFQSSATLLVTAVLLVSLASTGLAATKGLAVAMVLSPKEMEILFSFINYLFQI